MRFFMRTLAIAACLCVCGAIPCASPSAQTRFSVSQSVAGLAVHATGAPLDEVVREVARLSGIDVVGAEKLAGLVSVDFSDMAVQPALEKLLAGVNYILRERSEPGVPGGRRFVLLVHSMSGGKPSDSTLTGPIHVRALDALVAEEASDVQESKEVEEEDLLDDPDSDLERQEQKLAASSLVTRGDFGPAAKTAAIVELAASPNADVRREALAALASRHSAPSVLPVLLTALNDEEWDIRTLAVEIIGAFTDSHSLQSVGQLLAQTAERDVQISALRVFALRGEPEASVYVRKLAAGTDRDIALAARELTDELERRAQARRASAR
jgi:hypothetical protein